MDQDNYGSMVISMMKITIGSHSMHAWSHHAICRINDKQQCWLTGYDLSKMCN